MESVAVWQTVGLCGLLSWIGLASYINLTHKLRSLLQPWVARHVVAGAPLVLRIQVCDLLKLIMLVVHVWIRCLRVCGFAEISEFVLRCPVFWVVLHCFCVVLHCFSSAVVLGML